MKDPLETLLTQRQWPAVRTCRGPMIVPPQCTVIFLPPSFSFFSNKTCQGASSEVTVSPPTTLTSISPSTFIPGLSPQVKDFGGGTRGEKLFGQHPPFPFRLQTSVFNTRSRVAFLSGLASSLNALAASRNGWQSLLGRQTLPSLQGKCVSPSLSPMAWQTTRKIGQHAIMMAAVVATPRCSSLLGARAGAKTGWGSLLRRTEKCKQKIGNFSLLLKWDKVLIIIYCLATYYI